VVDFKGAGGGLHPIFWFVVRLRGGFESGHAVTARAPTVT